jgi:DNA-binding beta-propeller fold protein YncE
MRSLGTLASVLLLSGIGTGADSADSFIPKLVNSSTIPMNGDLNPYGVAFVPEGFPGDGAIKVGDVLVSNFNDTNNAQGRGTTIVALSPDGTLAAPGTANVFFGSQLTGLSTALAVLRRGLVVVGNVPTADGMFSTIGQGALQVIDRHGNWLQTLTDSTFLNGPWDLAVDDLGALAHLFVSNVNNGTVSRLDVAVTSSGLTVQRKVTIASGFTHVANAGALVLGPTGLALDSVHDVLFVASTADNAIFAITHAQERSSPVNQGNLVFADSHLRGPLGLRFAPNGHLLVANGDAVNADAAHPSEIVEFTTEGEFVREYNVDAGQGGAFGLDATADSDGGFNFAAVDDVTNNLTVYRLPR